MTLESYQNFVTIVECGSIIAASEKLLVAQPSLSNQLKRLEQHYGQKLLIRNKNGIKLTDAGQLFYQHAKEICKAEEKIKSGLNTNSFLSQQLRMVIPVDNTPSLFHDLLDGFHRQYPEIGFDLYEIASDFAISCVLNHTTELALLRSYLPRYAQLKTAPYRKEQIIAVFSENHPLARSQSPLTLSDVYNYNLAIPYDCTSTVCAAFSQELLTPNISIITSSNKTAIEWAKTFDDVALISVSYVHSNIFPGMKIRRFKNQDLYIMNAFIMNQNFQLSSAAQKFLAYHNIDFS